jgi:hypothetical protein
MADQIGYGVGIQQISGRHVLERNVVQWRHVLIDVGEWFVQRFQSVEQSDQTPLSHWFNDQTIAFLAKDGLVTLQLEVARYPKCLIAPIAKQAYMAFRLGHRVDLYLAYA